MKKLLLVSLFLISPLRAMNNEQDSELNRGFKQALKHSKLHEVIQSGNLIDIGKLLDDESYVDSNYLSSAKTPAVAEFLIARGAAVNSKSRFNDAHPLDYCCCMPIAVIAVLLKHNADPNTQTSIHKWTPLHVLADLVDLDEFKEEERVAKVKLLLSHDADPEIRDKGYKTPLDIAEKLNNKKLIALFKQQQEKLRFRKKVDSWRKQCELVTSDDSYASDYNPYLSE